MFQYAIDLPAAERKTLRSFNQDLIARVTALQQDLQTAARAAGIDDDAVTEFTGWLSVAIDYGERLERALTYQPKGKGR